MREGGGEPSAAKGWRWLAGQRPSLSPRPEPSAFGRFVRKMKDAMQAGGGEPQTGDGMTFWQRAAAVLTTVRDQAVTWAQRVYREVAERFSRRGPDDDPEMER